MVPVAAQEAHLLQCGPTRTYQLPAEILDLIISYIPEDNRSVALPATHLVTRTLQACLTVCRSTTASSVEQLYRHCLYIDSPWRLRALLRSYDDRGNRNGQSGMSYGLRQQLSTSIFLKPFSDETIDELNVVSSLSVLFGLLSNNIKRLVIDMPLRSFYPDEPGGENLRSTLRRAFLKLTAVEEFVSVRDEMYLSTQVPDNLHTEPYVWTRWHMLRRLALYNFDVDEEAASSLKIPPLLTTVMLTRPDGEEDIAMTLRYCNLKLHIGVINTMSGHSQQYRNRLAHAATRPFGTATWQRVYRTLPSAGFRPLPLVDIVCVDGRSYVKESRIISRDGQMSTHAPRRVSNNWAAHDLGRTFNPIKECQEWVKRNALDGTLWPELDHDWPPLQDDSRGQGDLG